MKENYIQNQFCIYEIALKLKELGFDEECLGGFLIADEGQFAIYGLQTNHEYLSEVDKDWLNAPTWQQAIDWLSLNHKITIRPCFYSDEFQVHKEDWDEDDFLVLNNKEQAILKAIELCQKRK